MNKLKVLTGTVPMSTCEFRNYGGSRELVVTIIGE